MKLPFPLSGFLLSLTTFVVLSNLCSAGGSAEHSWSDETLLRDWQRDVYVVQVVSIERRIATNGNPPYVVLRVLESLRGDRCPGSRLLSIWHPMPHDIDTGGREQELEKWSQTHLPGPKVGEKWIVMEYPWIAAGFYKPDGFHISARCRFNYTKKKRDWVSSLIDEDWRRRRAGDVPSDDQ